MSIRDKSLGAFTPPVDDDDLPADSSQNERHEAGGTDARAAVACQIPGAGHRVYIRKMTVL